VNLGHAIDHVVTPQWVTAEPREAVKVKAAGEGNRLATFRIDVITDGGWSIFGPGAAIPFFGVADSLAEHDLALVRPALLYADEVTLRTGNFLIAGQITDRLTRSRMPLQAIGLFVHFVLLDDPGAYDYLDLDPSQMPSLADASAFLATWAQSVDLVATWSKDEALAESQRWFREVVEPFVLKWESAIAAFLSASVPALRSERDALISPDLRPAIENGTLTVRPHLELDGLDLSAENDWFMFDGVQEYRELALDAVAELITSGDTTPLLDPWAVEVARSEDLIQDTAARSFAASFGATLLSATTGVGRASVQELLDMREEFRPELVRFRAAMMKAADEYLESDVEHAASWLVDHQLREVDPALVDIAEAVERNRYAAELLDVVRDPKSLLAPAGTLLVAASTSHLETGSVLAAGLALGLPLARASKAINDRSMEIRRNPYFLLHQLHRR
jgi:hypothetical protein